MAAGSVGLVHALHRLVDLAKRESGLCVLVVVDGAGGASGGVGLLEFTRAVGSVGFVGITRAILVGTQNLRCQGCPGQGQGVFPDCAKY